MRMSSDKRALDQPKPNLGLDVMAWRLQKSSLPLFIQPNESCSAATLHVLER